MAELLLEPYPTQAGRPRTGSALCPRHRCLAAMLYFYSLGGLQAFVCKHRIPWVGTQRPILFVLRDCSHRTKYLVCTMVPPSPHCASAPGTGAPGGTTI
jgi:hypothetical protein